MRVSQAGAGSKFRPVRRTQKPGGEWIFCRFGHRKAFEKSLGGFGLPWLKTGINYGLSFNLESATSTKCV
jgi:hypothetical protein